jgi:transcriptional regulator
MNNFTQESLSVFYNETQKTFMELREKIKTQAERIKKLEEQNNSFILNRAIENEKNENLLYKLSVMNDKILSSEQKVNDLNNIMMKHFAYKSKPISQGLTPSPLPTPSQGFTFQPKV